MKASSVTATPCENAALLLDHIDDAEAILVGAASGMSAAVGHRFYYERDPVFEDSAMQKNRRNGKSTSPFDDAGYADANRVASAALNARRV